MPFARCRFYDGDGNPTSGGCFRGAGVCPFIHPGEPGWKEARIPDSDANRGGRGRGSARGFGRGSGPGRHASTSNSDTTPPATSVWNTSSSWGSEPAKQDQTSGGGGWDSWGSNTAATQPASSWASKEPEPSPWADSTGSVGGGKAGDGDVSGISWPETASKATGWAQPAADAGTWATNGGGWDQPAADAGTWATGGGGWDQPTDLNSQATQKPKDPTPTPALPASVVTPHQPPIDVVMPDAFEPPPSAHSLHGFSVSRPVSPTCTETTDRTLPAKVVGPHARSKLWKEIVKIVSSAVKAQLALWDADDYRRRYKDNQSSDLYARIGPAGRAKLDNGRKEYEQPVMTQSKQLDKYLRSLHNVPEMDRTFLDLSSVVDEKATSGYVEEVKEWIGNLRPLLIKINAEAQLAPSRLSSVEDGQILDEELPTKRKRSQLPTAAPSIFDRIMAVEERLSEMQNEVHLQAFGHAVKEEVDRALEAKIESMRQAGSMPLSPVERISKKDGELGDTIVQEADKIAALLTGQSEREQDHNLLKEQNENIIAKEDHYHRVFTDIKKRLDDDSALNKEIHQKIQTLLTERHPAPFTLSESILCQVRLAVQDAVAADVSPHVGENFRNLCSMIADQDERMIQMIWGQLQPSAELVERLTQWVGLQIAVQVK